jgi:hypothetical protein
MIGQDLFNCDYNKVMLRSRYFFSTSKPKIYDLVCIGAYANKVGTIVNSKMNNQILSKFMISNESKLFEPQLIHQQKTIAPFNRIYHHD